MAKSRTSKTSKEFYQNVGLAQDPNKKLKRVKQKGTNEFVTKLEKEANKPTKKRFKFSKIMCDELNYYIKKYNDDYQSMARDPKNIYQDSPGQLRYKIRKSLGERRTVSEQQALSKLRRVSIVERPNETEQERLYRKQFNDIQEWNERYWAENNAIFNKEKDQYIKKHFGEAVTSDQALSHDQLAPFYRDFLNKNRNRHVLYNKTWYAHHIALIYSSFKAKVSRLKVDLGKLNKFSER